MQVPCSMPLTQAWSPVGYQVVLLPEVDVATGKPPEVNEPPAQAAHAEAGHARAIPSSPVGYRVTLVHEDRVPAARCGAAEKRPARTPMTRSDNARPPQRPRPRSNGMAIWLPLVVIAAFGLPVSLAMAIMASQRQARPANALRQDALRQDGIVVPPLPQAAQPDGPAEQVGAAVENVAADPADDCLACAADQADRQHFGTAVGFVRNPSEAARVARAERKLTFLLHVSGNFDDPAFT